jgi:hypothetical protein
MLIPQSLYFLWLRLTNMTMKLLPSSPKKKNSDSNFETQIEAATTPASFTNSKIGSFALFCWQHPDFLKLIFQCIFSSLVLCFCMFQLSIGGRDGTGTNNALYWGGITSILAWWMPSPGSSNAKNQANVVAEELNVKATVTSADPPSKTDN